MRDSEKIGILLNNLKQCPFCGGSPELVSSVNAEGCVHYVRCKVCHTYNGFGRVRDDNSGDSGAALMAALVAWNKRDKGDTHADIVTDARSPRCREVHVY